MPARGVKKAPGKTDVKASAGDFLKQRLGKKVPVSRLMETLRATITC